MNRCLTIALVVLLLTGSMAIPAFSSEQKNSVKEVVPIAPSGENLELEQKTATNDKITGEIISVNAEESTIVLRTEADVEKGASQEVSFVVEDKTIIEKDNQPSTIADLKAGQKVNIEYSDNEEGQKVAKFVRVNSSEEVGD